MLRKVMFGAMAVATLALALPTTASARGGFHGGGFHGGGFHGGFYRGGFYRGPGFGFGYPGYYGYGPYGYGYGYPSIYRYEDLGGCRLANQRVRTSKGWRVRRVEVCE